MRLPRHTLVWVRPDCRADVAGQITDDALCSHVSAWLSEEMPLVVARQPDNIGAGVIAVGLALPPEHGKARIALNIMSRDIARHGPPLLLSGALASAPVAWQAALSGLDHGARRLEIELRVYGSLSWQALSGLPYLTPRSDIDLLWQACSSAQLRQGIALLQRWEQTCGLRADGEVLIRGDRAVAWRELATLHSAGDRRVLVKRQHSAELTGVRELMELLA